MARWNNYGATVLNDQQMERLSLNLTHNGRWEWFDSQVGYNFEQVDLRDDSQLMTTLNKKIGEVTQNNHTFDGQVTTSAGWNLITAGAEYRITELEHNVSLNGKKTSVDQYALYLQDELDLGPLNLTLSGRMDDHETYGSEFSPRAYALYNRNDNWVFKGGVGRPFKAPTISQTDTNCGVLACRGACTIVGNPDLKPETAGFGAGITAFHNDIKNKIQSDSWRVGHRPKVMTYSNVAEARIRDVEINGWVDITDDLNLSANGTILDSKDMTTGLDLNKTPEHLFNAKLEWQTLDTLSARVGWNYVGSQTIPVPRMTGATYDRSEDYHTFDLGLPAMVWHGGPDRQPHRAGPWPDGGALQPPQAHSGGGRPLRHLRRPLQLPVALQPGGAGAVPFLESGVAGRLGSRCGAHRDALCPARPAADPGALSPANPDANG